MKLTSPSTIKYIMEKYGFRFSKSLGQNFLISEFIVEDILDGAEITEDDYVLEVGPGIGVLTKAIAGRAKQVTAIEIDKSLLPVLNETLAECDNVSIVNGDILKLDIDEIINTTLGGNRPKVVANLPYYVTTPIIMKLLEENANVSDIVVMVQKEVADRMVSLPNNKTYGGLSVAVQFYSEASIVTKVPRTSFMPQPNVESTVIRLKVRDVPPVELEDRKLFFATVKAAFAMRRKTLLNTISNGGLGLNKDQSKYVLDISGIDPIRRGETLDMKEFAILSNNIYKMRNNLL